MLMHPAVSVRIPSAGLRIDKVGEAVCSGHLHTVQLELSHAHLPCGDQGCTPTEIFS